ncbi:MAG: hypothetical protein R3D02_05680 [Hyphomicrobiales bacterium]
MNLAIPKPSLLPASAVLALMMLAGPAVADGGGNQPDAGVVRPYNIDNSPPRTKTKPKEQAPASKPKSARPDKSLAEERRDLEKEIRTGEREEKKLNKKIERLVESDKKLAETLRKKFDETEEKKSQIYRDFAKEDDEKGACCGGGKAKRQEIYAEMLHKIDMLDREYSRFYWKTLNDAKSWGDPENYDEYRELKQEQADNEKKLRDARKTLEKVDKAMKKPIVQP